MLPAYPFTPANCDHDRGTCRQCAVDCRRCEYSATDVDMLVDHVKHEHDIGEHDCGYCGREGGH